MWVWIKALLSYLLGRKAGEATQQAADAKATADALEQRAKTDDQVAHIGDADARQLLGKWSSGS